MYVDVLCRRPLNALKRQIKNSRHPGKQRLIALTAVIAHYRSCSSLWLYTAFPSVFLPLWSTSCTLWTHAIPLDTWPGSNTFKIPLWSYRMMRESRNYCDLSGATISSTAPEYYDWRLDERSCQPSYLRISFIGNQRPHPSSVGRIPRVPFFTALAYFSATSTTNFTFAIFSLMLFAFIFSYLLRCTRIHLRQTLLDVGYVAWITSLSRIVDVVVSGVACNRSCAIQTRHDDAWLVLDRWIALRNTFLTESHNDDHFSSAISLMIHGECGVASILRRRHVNRHLQRMFTTVKNITFLF